MLKRNLPTRTQRLVGASTIALATVAACAAAWAAQPARVVATLSPTVAAPVTAASMPLPPDMIDVATPIAADGREPPKQDQLDGADDADQIDDSPVIIARERDLTPEQRALLRRAAADAHAQAAEARAMARDAVREAHAHEAERAQAIVEAREAVSATEAGHAARVEAVERAQIDLRMAENDEVRARAAIARAPAVRAQIRAARAAVAEAAVEARAAHDAVRAERLERAVRVLDHTSEPAEPADVDLRIQN